jgi:hypothetical protein
MSLKSRMVICLTVAGLAALSAGLIAQSPSPLTGTWTINVVKSTYSPVSLTPRTSTSTFDVIGDTISAVVIGVDSLGRETRAEYIAKMDGRDYPWKGTTDGLASVSQDAVVWRKIDDRTYETTNKLDGRTLSTHRIVIATDGRTRTSTVSGRNEIWQTVNDTILYEKQ